MLPWLQAGQIERLLIAARTYHDDYYRDEVVVSLLARYAELHRYRKAVVLRDAIPRGDFQAGSWAALWPHAPAEERPKVFSRLTPADPWRGDGHAEALGKIAELLDRTQFMNATAWIVKTHRGDKASLLRPFVAAACQKSREDAYDLWETVLAAAAHRPTADAMSYLFEMIPVAEHVSGTEGLASIYWSLSRAAEQWP
jgi:hypothetical protein